MAFNPLRHRKIQEPDLNEQHIDETTNNQSVVITPSIVSVEPTQPEIVEDPTIPPSVQAVSQAMDTLSYGGEKLEDLQATGMNTAAILNPTPVERPARKRFNAQALDTIPLEQVLLSLSSTTSVDDRGVTIYHIEKQEITIRENKWYNKTASRGYVNAISLMVHINAIKEGLNDKEADVRKKLFFKSCEYLDSIQGQTFTPPEAKADEAKVGEEAPKRDAAYWRAITEQLNDISLDAVMEMLGATPNEDGQRGKWKVHDTGDNIQVTGQLWNSWKTSEGGGGAISLVAYHLAQVNNWDLRDEKQKKYARIAAINELKKNFGINDLELLANDESNIVLKVPFAMPVEIEGGGKLERVREYLHEKRGLPLWIINKQISKGFLFAGFPSDWNQPKELRSPELLNNDKVWATFLSPNKTAAEMRSIVRGSDDPLAKLLAKGSDKDLGGFILKAEKEYSEKMLTALEASIDAMSYHAIYPGRIATSCMGVNFNLAIKLAKQAFERNYTFNLGFDNDLAGNEAAVRFRINLITSLGEDAFEEQYGDDIPSDINQSEKIQELGFAAYQKLYTEGKIKYFDLGIRCLEECVAVGKTFYLDVADGEIGLEAVKLFQSQAIQKLGRAEVNKLVAEQKIRYLNVYPDLGRTHDLEKIVDEAITKLESGKPYYIRMKDIDENEEHKKSAEKILAFNTAFREKAAERYDTWIEKGLIVDNKSALAKDWNEYYIYLKNTKPEFAQAQQALEEKFSDYAQAAIEIKEDQKKTKKSRKP